MRRVLLALSGTVAGLVMLLSFKTHPAATVTAGAAAGTARGSVRGGSGAGGSGPDGPEAGTTAATGPAVSTAYGPMQVEATLTGGRITRVTVLQETNVGARSEQIDASATPELTKEALAAQSGRIDAVSGATYTSAGYIQSLQSALDKARS
jgi:hypothetical protein